MYTGFSEPTLPYLQIWGVRAIKVSWHIYVQHLELLLLNFFDALISTIQHFKNGRRIIIYGSARKIQAATKAQISM